MLVTVTVITEMLIKILIILVVMMIKITMMIPNEMTRNNNRQTNFVLESLDWRQEGYN